MQNKVRQKSLNDIVDSLIKFVASNRICVDGGQTGGGGFLYLQK